MGRRVGTIAALLGAAFVAATPAHAQLPDGRAYEVVTPGAEKGGGEIYNGFAQVAPDGDGVVYTVNNVFGDATNAVGGLGTSLAYRATREAGGWSSRFRTNFVTPRPTTLQSNFSTLFYGASADLSNVYFTIDYGIDTGFSSGAWGYGAGGAALLARRDPSLVTNPRVQGSSADGRHALIWGDHVPLVPVPGGGTPTGNLLYDYHDGQLAVVNVGDDGNLLNESGGALASIIGAEVPDTPGELTSSRYAVSADGSRVFFLSQDAGAAPSDPRELWVRIDNERTVQVSASASTTPVPSTAPVLFAGASADGTRAYFVTENRLTDDATGAGPFLYRFDLPEGATAGTLTLAAGNAHPIDDQYLNDGSFPIDLAQVIVSDDGSHVYFRSEDDGGSLYVYDADARRTSLVADDTGELLVASIPGGRRANTPDITPDGEHLAFQSATALTADDDNAGLDVYLYDAGVGELTRVSRAAAGATPTTPYDAEFLDDTGAPGTYSQKVIPDANFVSDDGQYVFFQTGAALVPGDDNGVFDVYRWRRGGEVSAISDVTGENKSLLNGASADGRDVFFGTYNDLIPNDGDDALDIYDARIGGGFPPPTTPRPCDGDACQGRYAPTPFTPIPTSDTFNGPGNANDPERPFPSLKVGKVSAKAKSGLARRGKLTVTVKTTGRGTVEAELSARLGKRWAVVDRVKRSRSKDGSVKLTLVLNKKPKRYLATHKKGMRVRVDVSYSQDPQARQATFVIRPATAKRGHR